MGQHVKLLRRWIHTRIREIEADRRYRAAPALVQINAPLALIQVAMETEVGVLKAVLVRLALIEKDLGMKRDRAPRNYLMRGRRPMHYTHRSVS